MKTYLFITVALLVSLCGCGQKTQNENDQRPLIKVGGPCEGCEGIYEQAPSFDKLDWIDTLPDFNEAGPKLVIYGIIYKADGKTPASNVVLYIYHTDQTGRYTVKDGETGWAKRHGYIRGWIKTNAKGEYKFYTLKPASYPSSNIPAHIHPIVKEPDKTEYWIDEFLFGDDKFLTTEERKKQPGHGGNGIINLEEKDGILYGERNIYLGRNIPDYPLPKIAGIQSGLELGDNCPAFDPLHISGADAGKHVCPMCKYGYGQGIMVWFNNTDLDKLSSYVNTFEKEMVNRGKKNFRVFIIYMNPTNLKNEIAKQKLKKWCTEQNLKKVAVVLIPSSTDEESSGLFKINPKAENTIFVYKKRKIADKWVNINYTNDSLKEILRSFEKV